tara:strand:+ start:6798 stop:6995 length:198 start_codon:yes stop_codon:yes gene_type:complete
MGYISATISGYLIVTVNFCCRTDFHYIQQNWSIWKREGLVMMGFLEFLIDWFLLSNLQGIYYTGK